MKRPFTVFHYVWFATLIVSVILALCKVYFWFAPILLYIGTGTLTIILLAISKGKVKQLPKIAKEAAKIAAKR